MVTEQTHDVEFDDICPPEKTKKSVACQAFVSCRDLVAVTPLTVGASSEQDSN